MPGSSSHHGLSPKASFDPRKSQHPDLDDDGNPRWETAIWPDPVERDHNIRVRDDPAFAESLMQRVAAHQAQLPEYVQNVVAGQEYGQGRGHYAGLVEYQQELTRLKGDEDQYRYGAGVTVVRDSDLPDMSLERYEQLFDERAQPRPGTVVEYTNRSVRLDDQIDPHSSRELRTR